MSDNPYIFGDANTDRFRLETQTNLFSDYLRVNAANFVKKPVRRILDLGCGEGQLSRVLLKLYPEAELIGVDRDAAAIEKARAAARSEGLPGAEYIVGNVMGPLPDGPFDLVYASLILLYVPDPIAVAKEVLTVLSPGGCLWVKDADLGIINAFDNPAYRELSEMFFQTVEKIGAHADVADILSKELPQLGYVDVARETELYPLGGSTQAGRAMLAITMGAYYNARQMMVKMLGANEHEIERLYISVINEAMQAEKELGQQPFADILAYKPTA